MADTEFLLDVRIFQPTVQMEFKHILLSQSGYVSPILLKAIHFTNLEKDNVMRFMKLPEE